MEAKIKWEAEAPATLPRLDYPRLERWLEQVARGHDREVGRLGYMFCDDDKIMRVNMQFLQHDYYTDIITFDYSRRRRLEGDMYISLDTVRTNAQAVGEEYERELCRVIVHGLLHLCGINDKGRGEREIMEQHENQALQLLDGLK